MKLLKVLGAVGLTLFAVGVVRADSTGGDSRIVLGGGPGGSPSCSSFQASADSSGVIANGDCIVTGTTATVVAFATPAADVLGGALTCSSNLTNIGWNPSGTSQVTIGGILVDECLFTAPSSVSDATIDYLKYVIHDPYRGHNDGDCDLDDFVLGIPVGCDITSNTVSGATGTDLFAADAVFDVAPTTADFVTFTPEPGSLALLMLGLVTLPFLRRKVTQ
ncbi:MAG: PEP-CTERM sorting domain-containing protein [Candidatus Acidiferrales bacterium]